MEDGIGETRGKEFGEVEVHCGPGVRGIGTRGGERSRGRNDSTVVRISKKILKVKVKMKAEVTGKRKEKGLREKHQKSGLGFSRYAWWKSKMTSEACPNSEAGNHEVSSSVPS